MNPPPRPSIIILHGANATGAVMKPLADALSPCADTYAPNMLAHGGREIPEDFGIGDVARDIVAYMDTRGLARAYVFGFSSGGCVALYLARHFPERFLGVCTLAAKYVFDGRTVAHWTHLTDPERLGRPGNKRADEMIADHHPRSWIAVTKSNQRLFEEYGRNPPLSEDDLRSITVPALLFSSNQDQIVPLNETVALAGLIPNAKPVLFQGQCHPFHVVPIAAMARAICAWIGEIEKANAASA
jgi:pimeloyl-ACP methyl ester carboxylesterase